MQTLTNQEKLKPWMGVVLFIIGLLFLIFPGAYIQHRFGMFGLVLTELGFLSIAFVYCAITGVSIKEVFPIKKISVRDFFGVFFLFIGGFLANFVCLGISVKIITLLGKTEWLDEASGLTDFIAGSGLGKIMIFLIIAVLPAICEESFMRGSVLSSFRSLKKDWMIIVIVGIFFGLLHVSPMRFLNTAFLGGILAFIMVKKNNIVLPMLLHFLNNLMSSLGLMIGSEETLNTASNALKEIDSTQLLGSYLVLGFLFPVFLVLGSMLLDKEKHRSSHFVVAGIISAVMLFSGAAISLTTSLNSFTNNSLLFWNYSYTVTEETLECADLAEANITPPAEGDYMLIVSADASGGEFSFVITDQSGNEIFSKTSDSLMVVSQMIHLDNETYTLAFYGGDDLVGKQFSYNVVVQ